MVTELEKQPILCQVQINLLRYKTQISKGEKIPGQLLFIYQSVNIYLILLLSMAPHSSTLAWKIPWMEEPGRLQSMGSLRVGHN